MLISLPSSPEPDYPPARHSWRRILPFPYSDPFAACPLCAPSLLFLFCCQSDETNRGIKPWWILPFILITGKSFVVPSKLVPVASTVPLHSLSSRPVITLSPLESSHCLLVFQTVFMESPYLHNSLVSTKRLPPDLST